MIFEYENVLLRITNISDTSQCMSYKIRRALKHKKNLTETFLVIFFTNVNNIY